MLLSLHLSLWFRIGIEQTTRIGDTKYDIQCTYVIWA